MNDIIFRWVVAFLVVVVIVMTVIGIVDGTTNGLSDCVDRPQYCRSQQERDRYWEPWQ